MSFASPLFLWYFLPAILLVYWVLPGRFRNVLVASTTPATQQQRVRGAPQLASHRTLAALAPAYPKH